MAEGDREDWERRWEAIQRRQEAYNRLVYPNPFGEDKSEVKQPEVKKPRPEDFGAVKITTTKPRPEDFGAIPIPRATVGASQKILPEETPAALKVLGLTPLGSAVKGAEELGKLSEKAASYAGEKTTDVASKAGLSPEAAAGAGVVANFAVQAVPAVVGGEVGKLASPALRAKAFDWMQSAIKPSWEAVSNGNAAKAIDTMLEKGIYATKGGMKAVRDKVDELNRQVQKVISESKELIDKKEVAKAIGETLEKFKYQANPTADRQAITNTWNEFKDTWFATEDKIPIQVAQKIKQGTTRKIDKAYGEMSDATRESQKAVARGLKTSIAEAAPEVSTLNAEESKLLNVLSVAEKRVLMEANRNPAGGIGLLAHNAATWAAFIADRSAAFKSLAAQIAYRQAKAIPASVGRVLGTAPSVLETQE